MNASAEWIVAVGCDGGPVMVLGADALPQWTGATPFAALRKRSKDDARRFANRRNVLHFWGNLGGAGERFIPCDSEADAVAERDQLRAKIQAHCPGVVVEVHDERMDFRDPASGGQLSAELEPKSEYDASWQAHPDDDAWVHAFGEGARAHALFWFVGNDRVHVGRKGDELVLLKHTVQSAKTTDADHAAACEHVWREAAGEKVDELVLPARVAVLWAPIAPDTIEGFDHEAAAQPGAPAILRVHTHTPAREMRAGSETITIPAVESIDTVGALFDVRAGRYAVSLGEVEANKKAKRGWSAQWCRLTRLT